METKKKQWSWPLGLANTVYFKIRKWFNQYENSGVIHKSKRVPHERFGMDIPETKIIMRLHTVAFTYPEIKWLCQILQTEDPNTTQCKIFDKCKELFEQMQESGRVAAGVQYPFERAMTKDEVGYVKMLLECIGIYRRPTPSERRAAGEQIEEGNW